MAWGVPGMMSCISTLKVCRPSTSVSFVMLNKTQIVEFSSFVNSNITLSGVKSSGWAVELKDNNIN